MPETAITREELLASVHVLQPGDVLIVRAPEDTTRRVFDEIKSSLDRVLKPLGVEVLLMTRQLEYEVVRPSGEVAAVAKAMDTAKANPGTVVEVED